MADSRIPAKEAGYMELLGATKNSDCRAVRVQGGISLELGCCNHFQPEDRSVQEFECGECTYHMPNLVQDATGDNFNEPLSDDTTSTPSFPAYKNNGLSGTHATFPKVKQAKVKSATLARAIAQSKRARQTRHTYGS
jgi:hypothetical protein